MLVCSLAIVSVSLRGGQVLAVQTASMLPSFAPGDALWVTHDINHLEIGDIVSYRSRVVPSQIISHRIVVLNMANQQITTKGDDLNEADPPIRTWDIAGKVRTIVPKGGFVLSWLFSWPGLTTVVYAPAVLILFAESRRLYASNKAYRYCLGNYRR